MTVRQRMSAWFDVRPNEARRVTLLVLGAFFVISFAVLARSIREALYLTAFDVETLPYIIAAVAVLSVPAVGGYTYLITRYSPRVVLMALLAVLAAGLAVLWPFMAGVDAGARAADVIAFYLWTALGTLFITSGFWVVTSEYFAVRGAKRLFGLIGAGGTAGAMVTGNALVWLAQRMELPGLFLMLIIIVALFFVTQGLLPPIDSAVARGGDREAKTSMRESLALTWTTPHVRSIAGIVLGVAIATTLLDYQFKEFAQNSFASKEALTSFFGAFYGWTGGIALAIQLLFVSRFLALAGIAWTLALLPMALGLGSIGMLIVPGLALVTLVRGTDASLRKSIYRSALEVVFVPVPSLLRRKTKTFVDSVVDSIGEALGAAVIFAFITFAGMSSRFLSIFIIALSVALIFLNRRMGSRYLATVTEQLQESGARAEAHVAAARLENRDLLSGTFTRLDIRSLIEEDVGPVTGGAEEEEQPAAGRAPTAAGVLDALRSADMRTVARALEDITEWDESHIPALARILAREPLVDRAVVALLSAGDAAVLHLAELLRNEGTDFVIRRRIPRVLALMGDEQADDALLDALEANRFEIRYRAAIALVRRRRHGFPRSQRWNESLIWRAVRSEIGRGRAVWEMQNLLDSPEQDDLVAKRVGARGELSLEHTFRLLSMVLEPEAVRAAFHGVIFDDERLKSFSLEYLDQVLPADVRKRLWPFIGDVSEYQREKSLRSIDDVVSDLMKTGATLFSDAEHREALRRVLEEREE